MGRRLRGVAYHHAVSNAIPSSRRRGRRRRSGRAPLVAIVGTRGYPSFYGGFETAVRRLAPALADRGWRVRVYCRPGEDARGSVADPRVERVLTRGVSSRALSTLSFGLTSVVHALFHKPDVALVMNVANGFWLPLLRLRGITTVVNVDGIEWERDKWSPLGKAVFRWGARFTARFADELIFDAEAIGDYWRREFHRDGVFVPYGGEWLEDTSSHDELSPASFVLLVARFVPENSVGVFLESAERVVDELDLDVVLVGSAPAGDPLQERARTLASENPRIHHLGHVSDDAKLFGLWKDAAVYFHGHTVGGTNPALVQAMALGSRTVARDTVYNREVLGDAAHYCDSTPDSVVAALASSLADPRPLEQMAQARAAQRYAWDLVVDGYDQALRGRLEPTAKTLLSAGASEKG
ncbi:DUF1972 domain-containing protein [Nocardioides sp. cx-169]|uniref:glycosyltransferase n=1 Tax=Nocardioides sp. cx-169 TaxID=2899080 RepID=UPI001E2B750D|nr:glycosyltransferase [Nocardioides sp. cx-169]MCD4533151.1 DUF1972 domain-containing protein [Nocardioides sp. cx-169]